MIVEFQNVVVIQLVHDLYLKLNLLHQVMLQNLLLVDNFDSKHVFAHFMSYLVNFSKPTDTNIGIS